MTGPALDLFLFAIDDALVERSLAAGVDGIVVDWECRGKHARQLDADTEVNSHTPRDLERVRAVTDRTVICRVNAVEHGGLQEIELAVERGVDEVLLPMVRDPRDVERALSVADGRVGVGVLVETEDAVRGAPAIGRLPVARVYLGLNDLAIERRSTSIFSALVDGTADEVRTHVAAPFGIAGVTHPDRGAPLPCRLLIGELARLEANFTFLRRSFRRDVVGGSVPGTLGRIRQATEAALARSPAAAARDRAELVARVRALEALDAREALVARA